MVRGESPKVELDLMHTHMCRYPGGNEATVVGEQQRLLMGDPPTVKKLVRDRDSVRLTFEG
jgi:hypothetical protein